MHITVLGGGDSAARFLADLLRVAGSDVRSSIVLPTTNDLYAHGLKHCPDIDAVLSACGTLAGPRGGEVSTTLRALGAEPAWLDLDDRTVAIDLVRTEMMQAGYRLSEVTTALARRLRVAAEVIPVTEERVEQHVVIDDEGQRAVHVQEYLGRYRETAPLAQVFIGLEQATATPAALEALTGADLLVLAPCSPLLHLDPLLRLPSVYKAIGDSGAPVLGVAGPAEEHVKLCAVAGVEPSAREQFADLVGRWAAGTAAEVLATGRELVAR